MYKKEARYSWCDRSAQKEHRWSSLAISGTAIRAFQASYSSRRMSRCNKCLTNIDQTFNSIAPLKRLTCEIIRNTRVLSQPISLQWNRSLNVGNLRHIWERNPQRARSSKYECSTRCQTLILNQQIIKVNESLSSINQKILMRVTWDGHHRSTVFKEHLWF